MAVFTAKRLAGPVFLSTSSASLYVVPAGRTGVVKQIILNNTGATALTVTANLVPNGASVTPSNQIISQLSIAGFSQIIWAADLPLSPGDSVHLVASGATGVTATISGIEIV